MRLQESGEMYLETILVLSQRQRYVRSIDVAEYMGYSKPSVSRAVSLLKQGEYITVDREGFLYLTDAGREVAEKIYERHTLLTELLISIGVTPEVAEEDACRVEHDISDETFSKLKEHLHRGQ
ncbi:MAG: metal-dependent transcriptional regulator [Oscillospiraceae bacterium]|nr:metal-dependent transcriptional regulator [Oscillospiraceae bacterium]